METYYNQFFNDSRPDLSVIIEDNGQVAYAYLIEGEVIKSDVWLYNSVDTPDLIDFSKRTQLPFLNSKEYTDNTKCVNDVRFLNDVDLSWEIYESSVSVLLAFRNGLRVKLETGSFPGWSNNVKKSSPLAKTMNWDIV